MGLSKDYITRSGITLNYWRINSVTVDVEKNFTSARVGGYVVKLDALLGKAPFESINYMFHGIDNPIDPAADPNTWTASLNAKIVEAPDLEETELEQLRRLSLGGKSGILIGATVVSDLPD
jgi:hypothetical protein